MFEGVEVKAVEEVCSIRLSEFVFLELAVIDLPEGSLDLVDVSDLASRVLRPIHLVVLFCLSDNALDIFHDFIGWMSDQPYLWQSCFS